jgi:hypothetical protein
MSCTLWRYERILILATDRVEHMLCSWPSQQLTLHRHPRQHHLQPHPVVTHDRQRLNLFANLSL